MELASVIEYYQDALTTAYGTQITPEQEHALAAIVHCRTERYGEMVLNCDACSQQQRRFHSCGHRSCPRCQTMRPRYGYNGNGKSCCRSRTSW